MKNIILFDNQYRSDLLPFTYVRPIAEIRVGILKISEKWEMLIGDEVSFFTSDYLAPCYPIYLTDDNYFVAGHLLPTQAFYDEVLTLKMKEALVTEEGELLALRAGKLEDFAAFDSFKKMTVQSEYGQIKHKQDIFLQNEAEIKNDFLMLTKDRKSAPIPVSNTILGDARNIFIEPDAKVRAATLNIEEGGYIYIGDGAEVMEGSNIRGSLALCEHAQLKMGAKIYGATTIGPYCKVSGEVSNSVFFSYSNKAHDGFVGNSVVAEWCNIGAGTQTSNLKNDYSPVRQWNYKSERFDSTGLSFCGLMMGDHSKCSIGTTFNTGTVVGVGCNIYGAGFHRNFIPDFSFGSPISGYETYPLSKLLASEKVMMQRRDINLEEPYQKIIEHLHNTHTK